MAVLGQEGRLVLRRETPPPVVVPAAATVVGDNSFTLLNQDWWTGDEVNIYAPDGVPTDVNNTLEGVGMYADGLFATGSNREHIADDNDDFYAVDDNQNFYFKGNLKTCEKAFIHRDVLDRISLYSTRRLAFQGNPNNRLPWLFLPYDYVIISASAVINAEELDAAVADLGDIAVTGVTLPDACIGSGAFEPVDGFPWLCQASLRQWSLELDAASVDTTCVGAKFGTAVKSLVNGGGTCDFMADRQYTGDLEQDGTMLMRLLMLTEKGAKASARFYVFKDRDSDCDGDKLPGSLYYEADILVTSLAINTRLDEVITGTARWVTTGEIRLKMG